VVVYSLKPRPRGAVSGLFLAGYGIFRFGVEYTREPDPEIGLLALGSHHRPVALGADDRRRDCDGGLGLPRQPRYVI
jgi:hypothetical protein